MPSDRRWSGADREMVANVYHWNASRCQPENCPGALECCYAGDLSMGGFGAVLDALTAAGWRPTASPGCICPTAGVMVQPGCTAHTYRGGTDE